MTTLQEKAWTAQQIAEMIDEIHKDPIIRAAHLIAPNLKQSDYLQGKWYPESDVVLAVQELKKVFVDSNNFTTLGIKHINRLIDSVFGVGK